MPDANEIKSKIRGTIESVADATREVAEKAADKAKGYARIAKLSVDINGEKDKIRKAYIEIGKRYYEKYNGDLDGVFVQHCEEITSATAKIAEKESEIQRIKADGVDDYDEAVGATAATPAEESQSSDDSSEEPETVSGI